MGPGLRCYSEASFAESGGSSLMPSGAERGALLESFRARRALGSAPLFNASQAGTQEA